MLSICLSVCLSVKVCFVIMLQNYECVSLFVCGRVYSSEKEKEKEEECKDGSQILILILHFAHTLVQFSQSGIS